MRKSVAIVLAFFLQVQFILLLAENDVVRGGPTGNTTTKSSDNTGVTPDSTTTGLTTGAGVGPNSIYNWWHSQIIGTHNSYHVAPSPTITPWNYTHDTIYGQLINQTVRHFELDFHSDFSVYHIVTYDENVNCNSISNCMQYFQQWLKENTQTKLPLFVFLEPKDSLNASQYDLLDIEIKKGINLSLIYTPSDYRAGSSETIRNLITTGKGFPKLGEVQGKIVLIINGYKPNYLVGHSNLEGRLCWMGMEYENSHLDETAFVVMDDPLNSNITAAVNRGFMVRTVVDESYCRGQEDRAVATLQYDYFQVIDRNNDSLISQTPEVSSFLAALGRNIPAYQIQFAFTNCGAGQTATFPQFQCFLNLAANTGQPLIPYNPKLADVVTWRNTALAAGAHFIATDYPSAPFIGADYSTNFWVKFPNGGPYRCNPVTAPLGCQDALFNPSNQLTTAASTTGISGPTPVSSATTGITTATAAVSGGSASTTGITTSAGAASGNTNSGNTDAGSTTGITTGSASSNTNTNTNTNTNSGNSNSNGGSTTGSGSDTGNSNTATPTTTTPTGGSIAVGGSSTIVVSFTLLVISMMFVIY